MIVIVIIIYYIIERVNGRAIFVLSVWLVYRFDIFQMVGNHTCLILCSMFDAIQAFARSQSTNFAKFVTSTAAVFKFSTSDISLKLK